MEKTRQCIHIFRVRIVSNFGEKQMSGKNTGVPRTLEDTQGAQNTRVKVTNKSHIALVVYSANLYLLKNFQKRYMDFLH